MRLKANLKILAAVTLFLLPVLSVGAASASTGKISTSEDNITIPEGSIQNVQLSLDAPIICPVGAPSCQVSLSFTSSDPARVSVTPSTVTWQYYEWAQTRTITINTVNNGYYTPDEDVTVSATAVTTSVYYTNAPVSVQLVVQSINIPPAPSIVNQSAQLQSGSSVAVDVLSGAGNSPDPSTLAITVGPLHGSAVDPSGTITYTPNPGYVGSDSLTYSVCSSIDPAVCSSASLSLNVLADPVALVSTVTSTSDPSVIIKAPSTGYGVSPSNSSYSWAVLGASIGLSAIGIAIRRLKRA